MCRGMCRCFDVCANEKRYVHIRLNWSTVRLLHVPGFEKRTAVQTDDTVRNYNARQLWEPQPVRILRLLRGDKLKDRMHNLVTIKSVVSNSVYRALNAMKSMEERIWNHVKINSRRLLEILSLYFAAETEEFYGNSPDLVWDVNNFIHWIHCNRKGDSGPW